jgi:hypothetical protein
MANSFTYALGRFAARHKLISDLSVCAAVLFLGWIVFWPSPERPPESPDAASTAPLQPAVDQRLEACGAKMPMRMASAAAEFKAKKYAEAYDLLEFCDGLIEDGSKEKEAYVKYRAAKIKEMDSIKLAAEKADKAERKKRGVNVGMTRQDAIDSSWGRPNKVNKTTTASTVREQWVYDGGYLYFENGVLTTIQN